MRAFSSRRLPPYRSAIATTNSSRTAMLTSLIDITPAAYRRGANQMRQQLSVGEYFWRGNALSHPDCRSTHIQAVLEVGGERVLVDEVFFDVVGLVLCQPRTDYCVLEPSSRSEVFA